jgi:hypothetical protein
MISRELYGMKQPVIFTQTGMIHSRLPSSG